MILPEMRYEIVYATRKMLTALPYLFQHLYPEGHPYSRLGIGTHESLSNITLGDIQQFVKTNYRPENTTLVVVGDFDLNEAQSMLYSNFNLALFDKTLTENDLVMGPKPGVEKPNKDNPKDWLNYLLDHTDHAKMLDTQKPLAPRE